MNQCKRLSDCPADRLAQCRGQAMQARCDALQGLLNKADQQISDLTHAAPVPPAGDVQAAAWLDLEKVSHGMAYATRMKTNHRQTELVDRAHVTRLTAERDGAMRECQRRRDANAGLIEERDGLMAEVARQQNTIDGMNQMHADSVAHFQYELTKARELLANCEQSRKFWDDSESALKSALKSESAATPIAHNVDESCGQGAEAAKCARCEASTVESCDEKGCGFLGAGNGTPVASTVNGLNDDEWQDRDDQDRQTLERE